MRLSELQTGESAIVVKIHGHGAFRKRVIEMGFVKGRVISVLLHAPLNDPIKYSIMGYEVSLRASEAYLIEVVKVNTTDNKSENLATTHESITESEINDIVQTHRHVINVALIGNPNCGKTSLFNHASGAREHVGNYSGVTVDAKASKFIYGDYTFNIVDLPGTYSLTAYSPEELYVRRYLRENTPDIIINVVDASNLERNLYLTTELIDMDRRMVIALNMYDELRASGAELDHDTLGKMIGVPVVPIVARTGEGLEHLFDTAISVFEDSHGAVRHVHVNLGTDIENAVRQLVDNLKSDPRTSKQFSPRYLAIKLLEGDREIEDSLPSTPADPVTDSNSSDSHWRKISRTAQANPIILLRDKLRGKIETLRDEDISSIVAAEKYGFIAGALAETFRPGEKKSKHATRFIDSIVTNKLLGYPLFLLIMFFIFWLTFFIGQYPMEWIEDSVTFLSDITNRYMHPGPLKDMIADGIIGGVGGVIVFLPNILILYFCISFMEDSGYMARAAFIMDKVMHRVGLHGKSFIPLIMGFGCNVPAILASRSIESRSSRIITILINPFMSCSARLPIYVLLIGTFFPSYGAFVFTGLYLLGIVVAVITARLLRRFLFKKDETPFVMELPPYRMPSFKMLLSHTGEKGKQYIKKMGGIILFASIIVWALNYFPIRDETVPAEESPVADTSTIDPNRDSYLEMTGKAVNPVMEPLGFHWRATVAAIAGIPAKEIVVSTLGVLYTGDEAATNQTLGERISSTPSNGGKPDFDPAAALSFMVFILLYCPCIASVTAIAKETGSWKYGAFSAIYNTAVAWLAAFAVYRIALILL